jgi:hypothetical protein
VHCPTTARQRLIAPHHDTPSIGIPTPCGTGRVRQLRPLATPPARGPARGGRSQTDHLDLVSIDVGTKIQGHRIQCHPARPHPNEGHRPTVQSHTARETTWPVANLPPHIHCGSTMTCAAHTAHSPPLPLPADQHRVLPSHRGPPPDTVYRLTKHGFNVNPPRPVNHIKTTDPHLDRPRLAPAPPSGGSLSDSSPVNRMGRGAMRPRWSWDWTT